MRPITYHLLSLVLIAVFAGCSSARPLAQPILQRDGGALSAEDATAADDLRACRTEVQQNAPQTIQPRWLPPLGPTETGVVLGTAGFPHARGQSGETYRKSMERCLTAHGYTVQGWQ